MPDIPTYRCRRLDRKADAPTADLDQAPWSETEWIEDFVLVGGPEPPPDRFLSAAARWDDEGLNVAFKSAPSLVPVTKTQRDDDLFNECTVEIFMAAGKGFYEIEVNPLNTVVDLLLSKSWGQNGRGYFDWSPQFATAVHIEGTINDPSDRDQYWSVEMALPWSIFASDMLDVAGGRQLPPRPGDEWRCNFYRYEPLRTGGVETDVEYSAWSPVGEIDFHRPDRFGTVVFAEASTQVMQLTWGTVKTWPC